MSCTLAAMRIVLSFVLSILLLVFHSPPCYVEAIDWEAATVNLLTEKRLSLSQIGALLKTEIENEISAFNVDASETIWEKATASEWFRLLQQSGIDEGTMVPMALCHNGQDLNGLERIQAMRRLLLQANSTVRTYLDEKSDPQILYNGLDMTCALTRLPVIVAVDAALYLRDWFIAQPVVSLMKLLGDSVNTLEKRYDNQLSNTSNDIDTNVTQDANQNDAVRGGNINATVASKNFTPPQIKLTLCRGISARQDNVKVNEGIAANLGRVIKNYLLEKTGAGRSRVGEIFFGEGGFHNISTEFDAEGMEGSGNGRVHFWKEAFEKGLDSQDGYCDQMIQKLDVKFSGQNDVLTLRLPTDREVASMGANGVFLNQISDVVSQNDWIRTQSKWCALSLLVGLSQLDTVCGIGVVPEMKLANRQSAWLMQSGIRNNYQFHDVGLNGTGQVVAVSDTGLDVDNCYFWDSRYEFDLDGSTDTNRRKVVQYNPVMNSHDYTYGHGTHVCGTIVGKKALDGINESDGMADGVAPGAKVAFADISNDQIQEGPPLNITIPDILKTGEEAGAKIHSASWGSDSNEYGTEASIFDKFIYEKQDFLIIIAAGNDGDKGFNTVGDPATAKNVITVGASHSAGRERSFGMRGPSYIADFSSKGSTADGRTKPDVVAPGKFVLSAGAEPSQTGECDPKSPPSVGGKAGGLLSMEGTSMATPGVAGIAAIVRQYFAEGWYPGGVRNETNIYNKLSGAAIKAIILNGAQPMYGVDKGFFGFEPSSEYDNIQNFGRVSLIDSLYLPRMTNVGVSLFDYEKIRNKQIWKHTFTIDSSKGCKATQFSVTLVWSDKPGWKGCRRCLINDLDLYVEKVDEDSTHYPNGQTDGPDSINNAERVRLAANDGDQFAVYVKGTNLVTSSQRFALVATGCFGGVANELKGQDEFDSDPSAMNRNIIIGVLAGVGGAILLGSVIYIFKG